MRQGLLAAAMGVAAINIWTGSPLFALWVGSQVQGQGPPKMGAVFAVIGVMAVCSIGLYQLMKRIGSAYDAAAGRSTTVRAHAPWLRSMRGEREHYPGEPVEVATTERIVVISVILAALAFEVWFFFFAGSPFGRA